MSTASQAGIPTPLKPLDITNAERGEAVIAAASAIRVRRNPASFAALCLIDSIQREHSALMASMHYDDAASLADPYGGQDDAARPPRG